MDFRVTRARDGKHKLIVEILDKPSGKIVKVLKVGAYGYDDFTTTGDENKKEMYLKRHAKREDWDDPLTKGFWARWLLWNKPSLEDSIKDVISRI